MAIVAMIGSLITLIAAIRILIAAFQDSVVTGLLTFCVPFYIFYFIFAKWEDEKKMMWFGMWLGGVILNIVGTVLGGGLQAG